MLEMKNASISELNLRIISMEETNNDETLLWRIGGLQRRRQEAIGGRVNSLSSSVFYTSWTGQFIGLSAHPPPYTLVALLQKLVNSAAINTCTITVSSQREDENEEWSPA